MKEQQFASTIVRCTCGHEAPWCVRVESARYLSGSAASLGAVVEAAQRVAALSVAAAVVAAACRSPTLSVA